MRPRATPGPAHWQQRKDSTAFMISIDFRSDDRWQRPAATHPARLARIRVRSSVIVTTASESARRWFTVGTPAPPDRCPLPTPPTEVSGAVIRICFVYILLWWPSGARHGVILVESLAIELRLSSSDSGFRESEVVRHHQSKMTF